MPLHNTYTHVDGNKTVLLIHGLAAQSKTWHSTVKYLQSNKYNTLTVDLAGHGDSPRKEKYTYHEWVEDIETVCFKYGIKPDYIIAHSLGGLLALKIALKMRIEKLFLIDPLLHIPSKFSAWFFKQTMIYNQKKSLKKVAKGTIKVSTETKGITVWDSTSLHSFNKKEGQEIVESFFNKAENINITIFKPKHSLIMRKHHMAKLAEQNAEVVEISKAGHNLHKYKIREYMAVLKQFLHK